MIREMRILVCASEAPLPPLNGARLQLRALCEQLAQRHEVTVIGFRWPDQEGAAPTDVELIEIPGPTPGRVRRGGDRLRALGRREPVEVGRLVPPMAAAIGRARAQRRFDVAHVALGVLAGVAPALAGLPAVIAPLDAWALNVHAELGDARGAEAAWRRAQLRAVERFVASAYRPFARVVLVSEEDAAATRAADPRLRTAFIPNGVDAERFRPDPVLVRDPRTLLFTGVLCTPANEQAARRLVERVLPRVHARIPDARLTLAGRSPSPRVAALANRPGVEVVADAPDLRPLLCAAAVFACAMESGTGIKNKLLEAMACGTAAVATPLAVQGMAARDGHELVVADGDEAFATAVVNLLLDADRRERLGDAARRYVERAHSWDAVAQAYEALYDEIRV
jgi:polysaccharide biosynthesis protein PslH